MSNPLKITKSLMDAASMIERRLDASLSMIKGVSFSEYQLLATLHDLSEHTATRVELASVINMTPSGVTRALKPLEKLGYTTTTKDGRDARKSLASLTEAGVELVSDATKVVEDTLAEIDTLSKLTNKQQTVLLELLAKLNAH